MIISLIRTLIIYIIIIFAVRIMGKRQISELQTTELVVTLLISDLAVIPMQDSGQPLSSGLIPIFVLVACEIIASVLMLKSGKFRSLVCGKPVIIIRDGKILQDQMRELRITLEDLFEQLRQKDIFSINEVRYAIVETNGMLSVFKKSEYENVTRSDLSLNIPQELEVVIINDGEISPASMKIIGMSNERLLDILSAEHTEYNEIFLMTATVNGCCKIVRKDRKQ